MGIELAKYGCNIAICDVDMDGARDTVEELHLLGVRAFPYEVGDVWSFSIISKCTTANNFCQFSGRYSQLWWNRYTQGKNQTWLGRRWYSDKQCRTFDKGFIDGRQPGGHFTRFQCQFDFTLLGKLRPIPNSKEKLTSFHCHRQFEYFYRAW